MSSEERALACLARPGAVLAPARRGAGYGVYPGGDRRRRASAQLTAAQVRALHSDGALVSAGADVFVASGSGLSRARRDAAAPGERFMSQHHVVMERATVGGAGELRGVRAVACDGGLSRLANLRDAAGALWLSSAELRAAMALRADWEAGQAGLVRGSDWTAPPKGGAPRGAGGAQERALAARCDARRAMGDALADLAAPLRRAVERVCLHDVGLEELERAEGWPARSGKLALKLGLAQLAARLS